MGDVLITTFAEFLYSQNFHISMSMEILETLEICKFETCGYT